MRHIPLLLSAAVFALTPVLAFAADAVKAPAKPTPPTVSAPAAPSAPAGDAGASVSAAPASDALSDAQRTAIDDEIKNYLVNKNPGVLIEAMQEWQKRQAADQAGKSQAAITTDHEKIYADPTTPVGGNPKGDVTVVEFFDYQCGYCKMSEPSVEKLLKEDKNVKFLYKDFPILGPTSTLAAKAALAAARQGKYSKLHDTLMSMQLPHGTAKEEDVEAAILKAAKDAGLDVTRLKKDMADDQISQMVEANVALGGDVGAHGTPTFIINDQLYPGALQYDDLKKAVQDARDKAKKK